MIQVSDGELARSLLKLEKLEVEDIRPENTTRYFLHIKKGDGVYDPNQVAGRVFEFISRKKLKSNFNNVSFKAAALKKINSQLTSDSVIPAIEAMYFSEKDTTSDQNKENNHSNQDDKSNSLTQISPEFLLLSAKNMSRQSRSNKLAEIFTAFLAGGAQNADEIQDPPLDFIQAQIRKTLVDEFLEEAQESPHFNVSTEPYLPFLAEAFQKDIAFLIRRPRLLLSQLPKVISLYTFLYGAQLALNIRNWQDGQPSPKPLYFILESEKASQERLDIVERGYKRLEIQYRHVFPTLVILEYLIDRLERSDRRPPLWRYAHAIKSYENPAELQRAIRNLYVCFVSKRSLSLPEEARTDPCQLLDELIQKTYNMFQDKEKFSGQVRQNRQTFEKFRDTAARPFIQQRGQLGRTLVVNHDNLLLLTNLAIGEQPDLSFQNLLAELQSRGIYFDRQSEPELIKIYERIGNIERMSDTGNAVKIRKSL